MASSNSTSRKAPVRPSGFAAENVPVEIKTEIGELITQWSYVAFQLGVVARVGFDLRPEVGFALLSTVDLQPLCGALRTLAKGPWIPDERLKADIEQLAADVQQKKDRRNDFAHGVYGMVEAEGGRPMFVRFRFRDGVKGKAPYEPVTVELLRTLADEAYDFGRRAQDLTVALKALPQEGWQMMISHAGPNNANGRHCGPRPSASSHVPFNSVVEAVQKLPRAEFQLCTRKPDLTEWLTRHDRRSGKW